MGASESTARPSNQIQEEERRQENTSSLGAAVAIAAGIGTAWVISRMVAGNTETHEKDEVPATEPKFSNYLSNHRQEAYEAMHGSNGLRLTTWSPPLTWSPPPPGRFKMNTDAGCRPNQTTSGHMRDIPNDSVKRGPTGYGGILRDHRGKWLRCFHGSIGVSDCLTAEFHGILKGLLVLDKYGYTDAILESDCTAAVDKINKNGDVISGNSSIIRACTKVIEQCQLLIKKNGITITHCSRDANKCADKLATEAIDTEEWFEEITSF